MAPSSPKSHVSPSDDPLVRDIVARLRAADGLWERLCEKALWQYPAGNQPVHSEAGALAHVFNELGEVYSDCDEEIRELREVLRPGDIIELLHVLLPRRVIERGPWDYWMRVCGSPGKGSGLPDEAFGDPNRFFGGDMFDGPDEDDDPYDPLDPTVMPLLDPDENTVWLVDPGTDEVYPVVVG